MRTLFSHLKHLGFLSLAAVALLACNNGGGQNNPSLPPPSEYSIPQEAPGCLHSKRFHDHDDMCRFLRNDQADVCSSQERYNYFQSTCPSMNWQDRDHNSRPNP